jgi:hypothetical protein
MKEFGMKESGMTIGALHADGIGPHARDHGADHGVDHGADHGAAMGAAMGAMSAAVAARAPAAPSPLAQQGGDGASDRTKAGRAKAGRAKAARRPADPRAILRADHGAQDGARDGAQDGAQDGALRRAAREARHHDEKPDADYVVYRLEEAGATLLALPGTGWSPRLRTSQLDIVRTALEAYGWEPPRARPPAPSAGRITRMDEALGWVTLIPRDRYVLRRIVGARALVSPLTERHLFSWRRLGVLLGADHKAIQRWHGEGIRIIVAALNASPPR